MRAKGGLKGRCPKCGGRLTLESSGIDATGQRREWACTRCGLYWLDFHIARAGSSGEGCP